MKNILFILSFICISCNAQQQIIPLGTKGFHIEGAYYKDISGDLNAYEGTWQGVFNNRTFIITFVKVKELEPIGKYYQDRLLGRYKMLDGNGNQLYSTYNLVDKDVKVTSLGFVNSTSKNKLRFYFSDLCRGVR
ncbi:hypothetical protein CQ046_11725 [Chryseobacterium sp. MYb7]|uniref:DUF6705 family protein n=1 Tax=Chryseobacterium sp. MYb7 TaxID=1827290 RepID=UPI000CFE9DCB|nr:DUF6705 family protein [Chryseobacterium sp. MYb7]PRB02865.1 hypothetical protein CQ046_11725 [Chryseobacterium sp. MYb7]